MQRKESEKPVRRKISSRGGARANSGRPRGSTDRVTIAGLLGAIENLNGRSYVEILADDFTQARLQDRNLAMKYHHLIMSKVAANLQAVEVTDTGDSLESKRLAFIEAMAQLTARQDPQ